MNVLHFHLSDDEGWRLDIPEYPELAEVAAWRGYGLAVPPLLGSGVARYGGVYSAAEIGALVVHADALGIAIVPEIDIPGHCYCVLQAIPSLRDPDETGIYRSIQGFPNNCLNPAVEKSYEFLEAVFATIAGLFPAPWIHVGGDEVPHDAWLGSPMARALMAEHGWTEIYQLQSHFLKRVQGIIRGLGKKTGAWEEAALGGGVEATDSYLVAWRKSASGLALAEAGYDVVLAPAEHAYFDMAQSDIVLGARRELGRHRAAHRVLRLRSRRRLAGGGALEADRRPVLPVEREPLRPGALRPPRLPASLGNRRDRLDAAREEIVAAISCHARANAGHRRWQEVMAGDVEEFRTPGSPAYRRAPRACRAASFR